ncbi:hypothetical protein [Cellvibrio sp. QJXJ]|uniref:hypothetical protein n=1 Tax=Cellvibrio sp. QJXJ TaxID=2964606 RepID=UPI0021C48C34|nr:hypothetical protein [Cellvibrio sp. QJXJ]UUA75161.1 hypothetical protein NNX04_22145 [Cellvibrio sp. QJXJ]
MNRYITSALLCALFSLLFSSNAFAEKKSLPTRIKPVTYQNIHGEKTEPCKKVASKFSSYVSINIVRMYVIKKDAKYLDFWKSNRTSYGLAKFSATKGPNNLNVTRVKNATRFENGSSGGDIMQDWMILDRMPYNFSSPSLTIQVLSDNDSNVQNSIALFSAVSSLIPDFSTAAAITTANTVASVVDSFLVEKDSAILTMDADYQFSTDPGNICEGAFVAFSAKKESDYSKYMNGDVIVKDNTAYFNNVPISDVSHSIFKITVEDTYYKDPTAALNDTSKTWAKHFNNVIAYQIDYAANTRNALTDPLSALRTEMSLGIRYLNDDHFLFSAERESIRKQVQESFDIVSTSLATATSQDVSISPRTAVAEVIREIANNPFPTPPQVAAVSEQLERGQAVIIKQVPADAIRPLREAIAETESVISN